MRDTGLTREIGDWYAAGVDIQTLLRDLLLDNIDLSKYAHRL